MINDTVAGVVPIICAGGVGFNPQRGKVFEHLLPGAPMILVQLRAIWEAGLRNPIVVTNHFFYEQMVYTVGSLAKVVIQEINTGTAPAVLTALPEVHSDFAMVFFADMPLWKSETLRDFALFHLSHSMPMSMINIRFDTYSVKLLKTFSRTLWDQNGNLIGIFEPEDKIPENLPIGGLNPSLYCYDMVDLEIALRSITKVTSKGEKTVNHTVEYYLRNGGIAKFQIEDYKQAYGINDEEQLELARQIYSERFILGPV